jgi:hypothetical protein
LVVSTAPGSTEQYVVLWTGAQQASATVTAATFTVLSATEQKDSIRLGGNDGDGRAGGTLTVCNAGEALNVQLSGVTWAEYTLTYILQKV